MLKVVYSILNRKFMAVNVIIHLDVTLPDYISASQAFSRLGLLIANHPIATLLFSVVLVAILSGGLTMFKVTTNPIDLWSEPGSRARREKGYFDAHFG